jgi:hypothetical protein
MTYRKKPIIIEAIQWTGNPKSTTVDNDLSFVDAYKNRTFKLNGDKLLINTLEGEMTANPGDFIIKWVQGEFYPCKPDIFDQTYEAVDECLHQQN